MTGTDRARTRAASSAAGNAGSDRPALVRVAAEQPEALFDRVAGLAARLLGAPMGFVFFGDAEHRIIKGRIGWPVDGELDAMTLGARIGQEPGPLAIVDPASDPRGTTDGCVAGAPVRFLAGAPIRTARGESIGAVCVADVAARTAPSAETLAALGELAALAAHQLENARSIQSRLIDFIETGSDWQWETDAEHRFTGFLELHDIFADDAAGRDIGKRRWELAGVDRDDPRWAPHIADLEARRPFRDFEYTTHDMRGGEHHLRVTGKPIFADDGSFVGYRGTATDITEQKRWAEQLRESEDRFRQIADSVPGIIWMSDADGRLTFLNRAFEDYTGKPAAMYYGKATTESSHPDDVARLMPLYETAAHAHQRLTYEYRVRRGDGQYRWFLDTCVPRFDDSGGFLGYIGMMTDVHDMRQMAEQLHQAQKMQAVGQLTGGVAHDFNNLLTIILGNTELLASSLADPKLQRLAEATRAAAERSASLVQRLLAFSRRQTLQPEVLDIAELVQGMRELLLRTLGENIEIGFSFASGEWLAAVDRSQFEAAIINLAANARDAMPDGGRLTIETSAVDIDDLDVARRIEVLPGRYVLVAVSDDGEGMTEEVRRHAFEPFYTTKDVGKGSGLGLSMVYGFIKQSGGQVTLYSEVGQGTSIRIYLPRADGPAQPGTAPAPAAAGGQETILLVEDDEWVRAYVAGQLQELGYGVVQAGNGPEALLALERTPEVALLLTDVVMPGGLNGRQLADEARRRRPALKVLFTTGYTENAIVHHGRLDPGVDLLGKPFDRAALAGKVRMVLDRRG